MHADLGGKKMSIKRRKISQITVGAKPVPVPAIPYGEQYDAYKEITEHVYGEPHVTRTIDGLSARLRMLQLMLDDCGAMIEKKNERLRKRKRRLRMRRTFVLITWFFLVLSVLTVVVKACVVLRRAILG